MKKIFLAILSVFLIPNAFSQSDENRFENRKTSGYYNITQASVLMGIRKLSDQPMYYHNYPNVFVAPSVTMINGIIANEYVALGIGVGVEFFEYTLFPVFFDFRRVFNDNDVSPFFTLKIGYSIADIKKKYIDNHQPNNPNKPYFKNQGGFMLNPEIGVKIPMSENSDLLLTVAYRYQKINTKDLQWTGHLNENETSMNLLSFGVAFMFR